MNGSSEGHLLISGNENALAQLFTSRDLQAHSAVGNIRVETHFFALALAEKKKANVEMKIGLLKSEYKEKRGAGGASIEDHFSCYEEAERRRAANNETFTAYKSAWRPVHCCSEDVDRLQGTHMTSRELIRRTWLHRTHVLKRLHNKGVGPVRDPDKTKIHVLERAAATEALQN